MSDITFGVRSLDNLRHGEFRPSSKEGQCGSRDTFYITESQSRAVKLIREEKIQYSILTKQVEENFARTCQFVAFDYLL